jgi:hypothetical protein
MWHRELLVGAILFVSLGTIAAAAEDYQALINRGGVVNLPAGVIEISEPLVPPRGQGLVLRGQGPGRTILKLTADLETMLTIEGKISEDGRLGNFAWWEVSNLTMDGDGHTADAIRLHVAVLGKMDRVEIIGFKGHAINASQWWDSMLLDVHFAKCGEANTKKAAVVLKEPTLWKKANGEPCSPYDANCNNISFIGCRFEASNYTGLEMDEYATKNRFVSCKWHGTLAPLNQERQEPAPFDHVHMRGAYDNAFEACNLTNCGGSAVVLTKKCVDNSFTGCHIGNARRYGVEVHESEPPQGEITWSTTGGKNRMGNSNVPLGKPRR